MNEPLTDEQKIEVGRQTAEAAIRLLFSIPIVYITDEMLRAEFMADFPDMARPLFVSHIALGGNLRDVLSDIAKDIKEEFSDDKQIAASAQYFMAMVAEYAPTELYQEDDE